MKGAGKKGRGKIEGSKGGHVGEQEGWGYQIKNSAGRAAMSDTSHQNVDGETPSSTRKMQAAEKAVDNLNQQKMEKSEECGSLGMWRRARTKRRPASITHAVRWKQAPAAGGAAVRDEFSKMWRTTRRVQ